MNAVCSASVAVIHGGTARTRFSPASAGGPMIHWRTTTS